MTQVVNLKHDNFEGLAPEAIRNLGNSEIFADVTLVSTDNKSIQAHKVVLASFSQKFEKILVSNPHPHPMIYLNQVDFETLIKIKSFIYLGEVEVPADQVYDFLKIGGDLEIVGLIEQWIGEEIQDN